MTISCAAVFIKTGCKQVYPVHIYGKGILHIQCVIYKDHPCMPGPYIYRMYTKLWSIIQRTWCFIIYDKKKNKFRVCFVNR